jgi:muramoyltetrapeptide carboxypeptidase LdcA involved in peptidoglycan recycling
VRYPKFLQENGTIGFVAPSFGCATEPYKSAFDNALIKLKGLGYNYVLGPNCYADKGIGISNTPKLCADELNEAYVSAESDVIISCGGGELMCEVVPYIDFDRIRAAEPKWYMGYSDNTNFTFLSNILSDTAAIYGPCAASFGMDKWHDSLNDAMDMLRGAKKSFSGYDKWELESLKDEDNPYAVYNLTEKTEYTYYPDSLNSEAKISGRLIGGCVDCLVNLLGTEFDKVTEFADRYADDGIIWFLECCDLNVMSIRRAFWNMKYAGWFKNVKGFMIGRPMHYNEPMMGLDQYSAVTEILKEFDVPVIMDLDIGHLPPMMPIISGAKATVTAKGNNITVDYDFN